MDTSQDQVTIDFKKLADSLRSEFDTLIPFSQHCCIYQVPWIIRTLNESVYTPKTVSIGPIHHDREELKSVEKDKLRYLKDFLGRTDVSIEDLLEFIKNKETRLRCCYAESIKYGSEDFVKMILLDAVFLIEIFLRFIPKFHSKDRIFTHPGMIKDIVGDMLLLENQIPIFILQDLFKKAQIKLPEDFRGCSLSQFVGAFFECYVCPSIVIDENLIESKFDKAKHFVDLVRLCLQPPNHVGDTKRQPDSEAVPHIEKLHLSGMKFKLISTKNLLDIRFSKGNLEIPKLIISNLTEPLLRNLQIFESLHCGTNYINDYSVILNRLLRTSKDVDLLVHSRIIENRILDSGGVSKLFLELGRDARVHKEDFYYSGLVNDLQCYCKSKRHKWTAFFKQNYLTNPWVIISVIAASAMLILTFLQTLFTIKK